MGRKPQLSALQREVLTVAYRLKRRDEELEAGKGTPVGLTTARALVKKGLLQDVGDGFYAITQLGAASVEDAP
jgi:hypothetical protein